MKHSPGSKKETGTTFSPETAQSDSLSLSNINLGSRETPWSLTPLLYRGGAEAPVRQVADMIASGRLGQPVTERQDLVTKIHETISAKLVAGGSPQTTKNQILYIRYLFKWAEAEKHPLNIESIQDTYLAWTDSLIYRSRILKVLRESSAYAVGSAVGYLLDSILERQTPMLCLSRLHLPGRRKTAQGIATEKQNLALTFEFGHFLQDICDALTADAVMKGSLPIHIPLRRGGELIEWSGYPNPAAVLQHLSAPPPHNAPYRKIKDYKTCMETFGAWQTDGTLRTRGPLANLRIEAELLIFISQTGINFTQAFTLKLHNFTYASHLDGYTVRDRKARRGGEVLFEVFKEYRPHFERYLDWRRQLFPESDELFPLVRSRGRAFMKRPQFRLRIICKSIGLKFISPQQLRNTRVNWLLRRSGDPELTAAMAQHQKETLLKTYERPSQQRAMSEVIRFWSRNDPTLSKTQPTCPGDCNGIPNLIDAAPEGAPKPDCMRPSGCLWCAHHRDIDSLDYLWSLACFRHLKLIELARWLSPQNTNGQHPAQYVVDRISDKMLWFSSSSARRREWAEEAQARVEEGNYHPEWVRRITSVEGGT